MIAAKPTRIAAERCYNGIKELKFYEPKKNAPILKYERPTNLRPGDQPLVADPFETRRIYIGKGVMQDGMFAKKDIKYGDLICYYSGMIYDPKKTPVFHSNMTVSEK